MPSIFTRIIDGEIPSRMVWEDNLCVAFLDVRPLARGHALVVPKSEIDQWTDVPADVACHCMRVAQSIGIAQRQVFSPDRIGLMIAGFEVPHTHIHVVPIDSMSDLDFAHANQDPDQDELDADLQALRDALRADGHESVSSR